MKNLLERLDNTKLLVEQKVAQINEIEKQKNQLTTEALELNGKIKLLNELIEESKKVEDENKKNKNNV